MNTDRKYLCMSLIFPLLSLFMDHYKSINSYTYALGFPLNFFQYYALGVFPSSRLMIFSDIRSFNFRVDLYIVCVVFYYFCFKLLGRLYGRYKRTRKHTNT